MSMSVIFIVLLIGLFVTGWHVAIEHGWASDDVCAVSDISCDEILESLKDLNDAGERLPSCAKVQIYVLGLSMAEYNVIALLFYLLMTGKIFEVVVCNRKNKNSL